ncbi:MULTISPECIES: hypothetical protein [unclassified Roseateles]|uniref:hypothetical protein n=1 Tax=unclassified Roseateles TaxID=2626991 RepID=UPI0006F4F940|nr:MULTISPECIES: hypothetical protein [unclassified Roseateles]KQW41171.1 hypothetical protein ASC81_23110 [Pelomonas sp. Root405]KRA67943.1 hypothetical protein ASD88_21095 [Pelomonas sp. Root662]
MSSLHRPRRRIALLQLAALTGLAGLHASCAAVVSPPLLDMQLIDRDSGAALARYASRGRQFSPGAPGARYAIRLSNRSAERVLVVLAVDGVNAITGDTAAWSQSGYVLDAGESHDITGWRKSDNHIATFEFTSLADSYAARTGRPAHVGVVGAAVFRELVVAAPALQNSVAPPAAAAPSLLSRLNSAAADAAQAAPARENAGRAEAERSASAKLGTGHGASEWSPIRHTGFKRRTSRPEQLLEIHYDSQANLIAAGVMPRSFATSPGLPHAFPNSSAGYVPDPPARW